MHVVLKRVRKGRQCLALLLAEVQILKSKNSMFLLKINYSTRDKRLSKRTEIFSKHSQTPPTVFLPVAMYPT
jgi:hypothetical protein